MPWFWYQTAIASIPPRRTHSLWKQPREKFHCEWVSPSWTRSIKTKRFVFYFSYPMNAPNHGIFFSNLGAPWILSCSSLSSPWGSSSACSLSAPKKHLKAVIPHHILKILWLIIHSTHFFPSLRISKYKTWQTESLEGESQILFPIKRGCKSEVLIKVKELTSQRKLLLQKLCFSHSSWVSLPFLIISTGK